MNRNWLVLVIGGALLWYGIRRGTKNLITKVYSYSFRSINITDLTVSLNLNILVKNPLMVGVTLKGVTGDVYMQGHKVGVVNTTYDYYLAGGKTHIVPVIVTLQMAEIGEAALLNIQSGNIQNLNISFDGKLYASNYNLPIPVQFDLKYNDLVK